MRPADQDEVAEVRRFFDGMVKKLSHRLLDDHDLWIEESVDGEEADVLLCSRTFHDLPEELWDGRGGLRIGTLEGDGFALDLQGAVLVAKHTEVQAVRVKEKAAHLFLYGRDILGISVLRFDPKLNAGDGCIVLNPRGEAIGLGEVLGRFKGNHPVVAAVQDLGAYLRDQRATGDPDEEDAPA